MARYSLSLPTDFEVPALLSVGGLLVAITLTKGGYALWAVGGIVFLYGLYLTAQCVRPSASSTPARSTAVADTVMKVCAFIACAMVAASVVMPGTALADYGLDQPTKAQTRNIDRPIEISLKQIKYCLDRDSKHGQTALNVTFAERDGECPIDQAAI
jgi:hypothetical protein